MTHRPIEDVESQNSKLKKMEASQQRYGGYPSLKMVDMDPFLVECVTVKYTGEIRGDHLLIYRFPHLSC